MRLKDYKEKKMQDPEFAKAYDEIQPEMNVIRTMIEARALHNLTAPLAITGDWGRPQRRDFRNWPAGQRMEIEHLSIQMPCFADL